MSSNPASEAIEILRRALFDFERDLDPACDAALLRQLKRIMLYAIAELEVIASLEVQNGAPSSKLDQVETQT